LLKSWRRATAIQFDEFVKVIGLLGEGSKDSLLGWLRENNRVTHPWFESMMARVSQHFAMTMRVVTIALALLLALSLHVDTIDIVNSLRTDQQLRSNFLAAADAVNKLGQSLPGSEEDRQQLASTARALLAPLNRQAQTREKEQERWLGMILHRGNTNPSYFVGDGGFDWRHLAGVLLTAGLLSLGAPFWFNLLKSLSSLRSLVAKKEEEQRAVARIPDAGDGIQWIDLQR
jgi:hypothetical protein